MRPQVRAPQQPAQPRGPQLPRAGSGRSHRPSLGQQAATLLAAMVAVMGPVMPAGALEEASDHAIAACKPSTSCVSSASFRSPSQYMPPWSYGSAGKAQAFRRLHSQLQEMQQQGSAQVLTVDADAGYIAARIRYSLAGRKDWDTTEVLLRNDGFALFRAQSELTLPSPPGCAFRGCINGPRTRGHLEQLQAALGWPSAETDEDRVWVPLLLH